MGEAFDIKTDIQSPQEKNKGITLYVDNKPEEEMTFKFLVGLNGKWKTLRDFSEAESVLWVPNEDGNYIIMAQGKVKDSTKPFDYISKISYDIGNAAPKIITNINLSKQKLNVGEKLLVSVEVSKVPVMLRYWTYENDNWQLIKDFSAENTLSFTVRKPGHHEIMVECKLLDSDKNCDDSAKASYDVSEMPQVEINDFKTLTKDMIVSNELIFEVEASHEDSRMILYKFIKINEEGIVECIQDYSTKKMVSYVEDNSGSYRLLCMAKDMYSPKQYDDRAIINFKVKPYKKVEIQSFTSDLSSPQTINTDITLKAVVTGGKDLLYRYVIEGTEKEDSGYNRSNSFVWNPKKPGKYKITLMAKDSSFEEEYEVNASIDFNIEEIFQTPVNIKDVIVDKKDVILKGETVRVEAIAEGGTSLRYSFIVKKDDVVIESVEYGTTNWVNYTPDEGGSYQLEVRVKDKYSQKEYDSHSIILLKVLEYIPAKIDYILFPTRQYYLPYDEIRLSIIARNTKEVMIKYVLRINNRKVEELDYTKGKTYSFKPNYPGNYTIEIFAKSKGSTAEFDCKRDITIEVHEALPITNTKISSDKIKVACNEPVNFSVGNDGGKQVLYEFYIMDAGEWTLVQEYSRKNFYLFVPFNKGKYKILVLCKSQYKNCFYEDYDMLEFEVE